VAEARDVLAAELEAAGLEVVPSQANFLLVRIGVADGPVCERLLRRGLLVRGGESVGLPGYVRFTIGPVPVMRRAAKELVAALDAT
jgi:histidinol-phosphate aminotransferase